MSTKRRPIARQARLRIPAEAVQHYRAMRAAPDYESEKVHYEALCAALDRPPWIRFPDDAEIEAALKEAAGDN